MSSPSDVLRFSLPTHGDAILGKMNALREEHRFCDVTLILGGPQWGPAARPLCFHGHRVVLAASSNFLRDKFLLHEGRAELSVGVVSSAMVAKALLVSCYTGRLEVPVRELVSYLTAASALQMSLVVEKCSRAVSQYLSPTLDFLNLKSLLEEKEIQGPESSLPNSTFTNVTEKDAAQPSPSVQETTEAVALTVQSKRRISQEAEVDREAPGDIREENTVVKAAAEISEEAACCLDSESEEGRDVQTFPTKELLFHVQDAAGALGCKLHPPAIFHDLISSKVPTIRRSSEESMDKSQNQRENEPAEEENTPTAQLQRGEKLPASNIFCLSRAHVSESHATPDDSDCTLVQRPYLCRKCDKVFQHLQSYLGHLKEHRRHFCLVCGKGFSQRSNLTHHVHAHTGVKPFRCPLCHKTFAQKATLQDHLGLHTGGRPFGFNHSTVHLADNAGLRRHLKESHGKSGLQGELEEAEKQV
ncbi:zinc finger and BTB domain-containing protein 12-like [Mugil cephalus]|uniref:zinc finger and BTB domain-containing protein 12-like n=1 Tax=Mugil cephalus TaxID=48193 RepID=UPI001FB749C7|nr:zinc finger and BTB domain-containing protein 12-like [Mugil cephalus]